VRSPGERIDRGSVQREVVDSSPLRVCLSPDEHFPVIGGTRKDVAVLWVCPGDGPDCSFVAVWLGCQLEARDRESKVTGYEIVHEDSFC
jgi:hypothetical protein